MFTSLALSPRLLCLGLEKLSLSLGSMRLWLLMERCEVTPVTDRGGRRQTNGTGSQVWSHLDLGQTVLEHSALEAMCLVLSVRQPSVVGALVTGTGPSLQGGGSHVEGRCAESRGPHSLLLGVGSTVSAQRLSRCQRASLSPVRCAHPGPRSRCGARFLFDLLSQTTLTTKTGHVNLHGF